MAISYVGGTKAPTSYPGSASDTGTCTITKPAGVVADDFLIAFIQAGGVTISPPNGWSLLSNTVHASGGFTNNVYYKRANMAPVRVLSFNMHHGAYPDSASLTLSAVRDIIFDSGADIIGLQEVDKVRNRSGDVDQAQWLANELGFHYAFGENIVFAGDGSYGTAILSRWPITSSSNTLLVNQGNQEQRGLLVANITVHGVAMTFANTHLDAATSNILREAQVAQINSILGSSPTMTVLTGDMNAIPGTTEMQALTQAYNDTLDKRGVGAGLTFPGNALTKRIDYVMASKDLTVRAAEVVSVSTSDHLPVKSDIYVPSGAEPADYTFTASAATTPMCGAMSALRGVDPLDHFAGTHQVATTTGTDTVNTPSITTTAPGVLLYFRSSREDSASATLSTEPSFATTASNTRLSGGNRGSTVAYGQRMVMNGVTQLSAGTHSGEDFDANDVITRSIERTIALRTHLATPSAAVVNIVAANKPKAAIKPRAQVIG